MIKAYYDPLVSGSFEAPRGNKTTWGVNKSHYASAIAGPPPYHAVRNYERNRANRAGDGVGEIYGPHHGPMPENSNSWVSWLTRSEEQLAMKN